MPTEPAVVKPSDILWRVERSEPPLRFSRINAVDAALDRAGNRFDVPGGGVLYGATDPSGAFAETLAGFRPSAKVIAALAAAPAEPGMRPPGTVPAEWRTARRLRAFETIDPLPFVDIEDPATHTYLTEAAARVLLELGVEQLDVATVRGPSRLLTRELAAWVYSRTDEQGLPLYGGIRYVSRLGDFECWAIFDGTLTMLREELEILPTHPALQAIAGPFGLDVE